MEDESTSFAGLGGLIVHWMNGMTPFRWLH